MMMNVHEEWRSANPRTASFASLGWSQMNSYSKLTPSYEEYLLRLIFGSNVETNPLLVCVDTAYFDFNRTLRGISKVQNGAKLHTDAVELLTTSLRELKEALKASASQTSFDDWHRETCVDDALRPSLLVKVVHVLRAEEQTIFQSLLQFLQCEMRRIRLSCRSSPPPHGVELPHEPGIAKTRMERGDLFDTVVAPEPVHSTERWDPLSALTPAPVRTKTRLVGDRASMTEVYSPQLAIKKLLFP